MAVRTSSRRLTEAELNAPDLDDDGDFDVEHYPLLAADVSAIDDPYLAEVWDAAVKLLEEGPVESAKDTSMLTLKNRLPIRKSTPDQVLAVMNQIGHGAERFTALADLGRRLGGTPQALHAAVMQLWRAGKITVAGAEGRHGSTPEERRWWLTAPGEENKIGYVMLRA